MNSERNKDIICEEVDCALCGSSLSTPIAYGYDYEYWTSEQMFSFVKCDVCGHIYLNPRPLADSFSLIYPPNFYTLEGRHTAKTSILIYSATVIADNFRPGLVNREIMEIRSTKAGRANVIVSAIQVESTTGGSCFRI